MKSTLIVLLGLGCAPVALQAQAGETLTLRAALESALANNAEVEAADEGVQIANAQVREAWATVLPDVLFNASYQRNLRVQEAFLPAIIFDPNAGPDDLVPVRFGSDNIWQATVSVTQPLFEARAFVGVGAANRLRMLEEERARGTRQEIVSRVRQAFFGALLAAEDLRLLQLSIERVRQTLGETQAMNRAGLASTYDVLRFEVQLSNLEAQVRRAENGVKAASRQLLVELGLEPTGGVEVLGRLNQIDLDDVDGNDPLNAELLALAGVPVTEEESVDDLIATARQQRSDLRQLRSSIDLEAARRAVERAEFFPKVSLFSNFSIQAQENGSLNFFGSNANERTTAAAAGVRVELPLFRGFSRFARVSSASASIRITEARLDRAERQTLGDVRTSHEAVVEARMRAGAQRAAVGQARRGYEIATLEYREGIGSQLQVTDAEVALRQSEFNYAQAVYDYLIARSQLDLALGTVPVNAGEIEAAYGALEEQD
jgi:outer membrane protein TolC